MNPPFEPDPSERSYSTELHLAASRDAVWEALTTEAGLRRWFAPEAKVDLRPGGEVVWAWGDLHRWAQRIEVVEPGTRLRTRYDSAVDDGEGGKRPLYVDFLLQGEGGSTTLRLVQSGFGPEADFDDEYDGISRGWPVELANLRYALEERPGKDRRLAWACVPVEGEAATAWKLLTGSDGVGCGPEVQALAPGAALAFTGFERVPFRGRVLASRERELTARLDSHGDAFLRVSVEACGGATSAWLWLASHDLPAADVDALQVTFDETLARLFPTANVGARS